jgi:hypothetical protein
MCTNARIQHVHAWLLRECDRCGMCAANMRRDPSVSVALSAIVRTFRNLDL